MRTTVVAGLWCTSICVRHRRRRRVFASVLRFCGKSRGSTSRWDQLAIRQNAIFFLFPTVLQIDSSKYLSNGLAFGICNLVNLTKRGEGLAYMPSVFTIGMGKLARSPRAATGWGRASLATSHRPAFLRTAHRSSINAWYSIDALLIVCVFAYWSSINASTPSMSFRLFFADKDSTRQTPGGYAQTPRPQRLSGNKFAANIHPTRGPWGGKKLGMQKKKLCRSIIFLSTD